MTSTATASPPSSRTPQRHALVLRCALLNIVALGLLAVAVVHGLVQRAVEADGTRLVVVIALVFVAGLVVAILRIAEVDRETARAADFDPALPSRAARFLARTAGKDAQSRQILGGNLRLELTQHISIIRYLGSSLVFLGLIGTVVGFIIALSGVDPAHAGNIDDVTPMVAALIRGMSTALVTTLVGGVLNIWLMANYQLLASGTVRLIAAIVELGEDRAGA